MTAYPMAQALDREETRRAAAHLLAVALSVQAGLAGVTIGVIAAGYALTGPFSVGMLIAALVVLAVLSSFAAIAEWNRERLGEAFAMAALTLAWVVSLVGGLSGLWWTAPALAIVAFGGAFALVHRFATRDEARHAPLGA